MIPYFTIPAALALDRPLTLEAHGMRGQMKGTFTLYARG
jgi:hypothetical protein